ncbi:MAG TPA: hypothetical protein VFZ22_12920 [Pyrinomonadaceae bacterium]|nr:hypothetical protein [Pyrinomonadaceae bacterium]
MSEDLEPKPSRSSSMVQRILIYAGVLLVVFLLGLVPMWLKARAANNRFAESERHLTLARIQNDLASAVIDARRAEYEPARQATSQFFTTVQAEVAKGDASSYTRAQADQLRQLFAGRDEIITLLARSDPASADRLTDLFVGYRKIMNG